MLKEVLKSLSPRNKELLRYSLEQEISEWIEYEPNKFIGVHVPKLDFLIVIETLGVYSIGQIKKRDI